MGGARQVEVQICGQGTRRQLVGHEVMGHQHVRLLENLRLRGARPAEEHIGGDRDIGDVGDAQRLER